MPLTGKVELTRLAGPSPNICTPKHRLLCREDLLQPYLGQIDQFFAQIAFA
jgi:hypothetical protein